MIELQGCESMITRSVPYGISQSDYEAVLAAMLVERNEQQARCGATIPRPGPTRNDQQCVGCSDPDDTMEQVLPLPTGLSVQANQLCVAAGVFTGTSVVFNGVTYGSIKEAVNARALAFVTAQRTVLLSEGKISCSGIVDCMDLPVIPDCPCDLGESVDILIGTAQPNDTAPAQVDFDVIAGEYTAAYLSGANNAMAECAFDATNYVCYGTASYFCAGSFWGYTVQYHDAVGDLTANRTFFTDTGFCTFGANYGPFAGIPVYPFQTGSGAPGGVGCPSTATLAAWEVMILADPLSTVNVGHFGGTLSLKYTPAFVLGSGDATLPEFEFRRIKQAVIEPTYNLRLNTDDYDDLLPVLVDGDVTPVAPVPWDRNFSTFQRISLFESWTWLPPALGTTTINGLLIDNFTRVAHNTAQPSTPTGCAWLLSFEFIGSSGASWVGYGGNGYTPDGLYVFKPDLAGWTMAHELNDVIAATAQALPTNTIVGVTLVASANGAIPAMDGVALILNDRVLVKDEVNQAKNGIYTVTQVGNGGAPWILTRATDADTNAEVIQGIFCQCLGGTLNIGCYFRMVTPGPTSLGTSDLEWLRIPQVIEVESY